MSNDSPDEFEEVIIEEFWEEPARSSRRTPPTKPDHPSLSGLVQTVIEEGRALVMAQVELFKIKAKAAGAKLGASIGLFVAALILVFYFLWWTFHTIEVAIAVALPQWAASLIVWALLLIAIAVLVLVGVKLAKRASEEAPTVDGFAEDIASLKEAVQEGKER